MENILDNIEDNGKPLNVDSKAFEEEKSYENKSDLRTQTEVDLLNTKVQRLTLKNKRYRTNTILRILFSIVYTWLLFIWLNKVIHILTHNNLCGYKLSDNVLIALLVTSTANVIGMVVIVLKNLFPEKGKKNTSEK